MRGACNEMKFLDQYEEYRVYFETCLHKACAEMAFQPKILTESMCYSLLSGGKRVRPVLFFCTLDAFGVDYRDEKNFAIALECIHTYSLIHDDLPAMDNDDFRRGRPSNHKMFGEANAILAGDALLSFAFDLLLGECGRGNGFLRAAQSLSRAAGALGMVAGQSADLLYTGENGGEKELLWIYRHKTGCLMAAPLIMAACIAGRYRQEAEAFGMELGNLFQLTDDILDAVGEKEKLGKTTGKDAAEQKLTAVKVYSVSGARAKAQESALRCYAILDRMRDAQMDFLREFVDYVLERDR